LPGAGKSTIAEHVARMLHGSLIAKDVVEATLWRSGVGREANSGWVGYELLGSLADAQLRVGGSVVVDSVAAYDRLRDVSREIEDARSRYEPWRGEHLVLDSVRPLEDNVTALEAYLRGVP
jgi:predicted kinase